MDKQHSHSRRMKAPGGPWKMVLLFGFLILGLAASAEPVASEFNRDIGCAQQTGARELEICKAISNALQWEWLGHAIIAPGWRVTYQTAREVYCKEHIASGDLPVNGLNRPVNGDWQRRRAT